MNRGIWIILLVMCAGLLACQPAAGIPITGQGAPTLSTLFAGRTATPKPSPTATLIQVALPTQTAAPSPSPTGETIGSSSLQVDWQALGRPVSPYIYGMSWADGALSQELGVTVNRWGGNATTRYNWQNNTSNRASDWFFENIPNENSPGASLPFGSASDQFVQQNLEAGTETILTLPLIGWTPKSRAVTCGFSIARYGEQQASDPYNPDCGNGLAPDGDPLTGNDPTDTSLAVDAGFFQLWLRHLVRTFGPAEADGVRFYNLDNEPMLWHVTHRDVHPQPVGYDEIRDRTYEYAAGLKAVDPGAQTLGPSVWGWTAYFYSALDVEQGTHPDREAHDGLDFIPWYLSEMSRYEQEHGLRLLDYLDLHYYPQAQGVALSPAGDETTQAQRLRSTRSLWDFEYPDESWIVEVVQLIPRMRQWVDEYYPGTKLAISEYNFGGLEHVNGALVQAEVLGIFGREGLDLAALWAPPALQDPGAFAFRMYRNYDGEGSQFGDLSLPASSPDPDNLSIFAARRSTDNALTLMVINKSAESLDMPIEIMGAPAELEGQLFRYSAAQPEAIQQVSLVPGSSKFTQNFPAQSISLLVLQEAP